jgi:hypothetical protein
MRTPADIAEVKKASPESDGVKHIIDLELILEPRSRAVIRAEIEAKGRARFGAPAGRPMQREYKAELP